MTENEKKAKLFLFNNVEAFATKLLSGERNFTIRREAYESDCEDEIVKILLSLEGVEQAMPTEDGIMVVAGRIDLCV